MPVKTVLYRELDINKPIVLVDFDHTLIDSSKMREWLFSELVSLGFDRQAIETTYLSAKPNGAYDLNSHVSLLMEPGSQMSEAQIVELLSNSICQKTNCLFSDSHQFLEKYSQETNLVLFTLGDIRTQMLRCKCTNIEKHLTGAVFTTTNKAEVLNKEVKLVSEKIVVSLLGDYQFPSLYFIDDHPREIEKLELNYRSFAVYRIRREGEKYSDLPTPKQAKEISSLSDFKL